jgi:hypothetical protein
MYTEHAKSSKFNKSGFFILDDESLYLHNCWMTTMSIHSFQVSEGDPPNMMKDVPIISKDYLCSASTHI